MKTTWIWKCKEKKRWILMDVLKIAMNIFHLKCVVNHFDLHCYSEIKYRHEKEHLLLQPSCFWARLCRCHVTRNLSVALHFLGINTALCCFVSINTVIQSPWSYSVCPTSLSELPVHGRHYFMDHVQHCVPSLSQWIIYLCLIQFPLGFCWVVEW